MAVLLGVDTGGTYTDAVVLDEASDQVLSKAKALTTRPDLAPGVGAAIDAALDQAAVDPANVAMVSLSTTLATNALVEGKGGRVALVLIGFAESELDRAGLRDALAGDPVIVIVGGHSHAGAAVAPLDLDGLSAALDTCDSGVTGFAVAGQFATRNPAHEIAAREMIRAKSGLPVTCSHELSSALGGPKRAVTAVLNARLIGMIAGLISACETHLVKIGVRARLMVVRGDGALIPAEMARERPIETILSGPAASLAGAGWLTGETDALVSDIGGTTTDVCLLQGGKPAIDPAGAQVGGFRTMVEAVAMRTTGLGGDSEVHVRAGLTGGLHLGPRRMMPLSLLAVHAPGVVHDALDRALASDTPATDGGQFAIALWQGDPPEGLDPRETTVATRLAAGPLRMGQAVTSRIESPALARLVTRGLVMVAGVTPSDAAHVLGLVDAWDRYAAEKGLALFARRRGGAGDRLAPGGAVLAQQIIDQMTHQTVDCLLQSAFAEDPVVPDQSPETLARHPLTVAGLNQHRGIIETSFRLGVPVIGLGASAKSYYGPVGVRLGTQMIVPDHADVANAIGAVVGQVRMQAEGSVTAAGPGRYVAHLANGPATFGDSEAALAAVVAALGEDATRRAGLAGVIAPRLSIDRDVQKAEVEGQSMFISATVRVTATGRPRIASG